MITPTDLVIILVVLITLGGLICTLRYTTESKYSVTDIVLIGIIAICSIGDILALTNIITINHYILFFGCLSILFLVIKLFS